MNSQVSFVEGSAALQPQRGFTLARAGRAATRGRRAAASRGRATRVSFEPTSERAR